jgi:hypothetical protein
VILFHAGPMISRPRARCAICGTSYDENGWASLPIAQELSSSHVRSHLSVPADWSVEVRVCRCGSRLARRSPS